jgi:hypothetical protein
MGIITVIPFEITKTDYLRSSYEFLVHLAKNAEGVGRETAETAKRLLPLCLDGILPK